MQDTNKNKRQENLLKIENKLHEYLHQYNNKFDSIAYTKIALGLLETNASLEQLNVSEFINKDNNNNGKIDSIYNNNNKCFHLIKDGENFVAVGADGTILDGKNFEEINDKVCQQFIQIAKTKGKECLVGFYSKDPDKLKIFSKNAIIKFGITIYEGYSDDPKFWQSLKNEYLNDKKHSLQDWERITRLIPDNIMQRTDEEKKRNQQLIKELADKKISNKISNLMEKKRKQQLIKELEDKKVNNKTSNLTKQLNNELNPNLVSPSSQQKINGPQKLVLPNKRGRVME